MKYPFFQQSQVGKLKSTATLRKTRGVVGRWKKSTRSATNQTLWTACNMVEIKRPLSSILLLKLLC